MSKIAELLQKNESDLLADWMKEQLSAVRRRDLMDDNELRSQSVELLRAIAGAASNGNVTDVGAFLSFCRSDHGKIEESLPPSL